MWVVQVQNITFYSEKHYIHEIDALVSLDRAECFALEKKKNKTKQNTQKQLHSSSKIVSLRSQRFRGIQMYKINFVSRDLCTRCGPVCLWKVTLTHTHCYMPDDIVGKHYSELPTKMGKMLKLNTVLLLNCALDSSFSILGAGCSINEVIRGPQCN